MRTIGVVTVGRSDYSIYLPFLRKIHNDVDLQLCLIVAGMHLSAEFGFTVKNVEADGFDISERVELLLSSDSPQAIGKSMGLGTFSFAQVYERIRPDILVVLGDRFEMHAAALAALPFKIPLAHIHGGEITQGAIDDALRHSITKLSHLHFVSTEEYARRVRQMGEETWRVVVSGAPALDNIRSTKLLTPVELANKIGFSLDRPPILVTYHSVTLEYEQTEWQIKELLEALEAFDLPVVFTGSNADTNGRIITRKIETFVDNHPATKLIANLGTQAYFSILAHAAVMVGNSSSGIIEAPSFGLPVVNVGSRQHGRVRARNVIDVGNRCEEIIGGIRRALDPGFRTPLEGIGNPFGDGQSAGRIVDFLKKVSLDETLLVKKFQDIPEKGALNS